MRWVVRVTAVAMVVSVVVFARRDYAVSVERVVPTRAQEVAAAVDRSRVFALPFAASFIAVHWPGHRTAALSVELSTDGQQFEAALPVVLDEAGEGHPGGETFGALIAAHAATHVRVSSDRPIGRVSVLSLTDGEPQLTTQRVPVDEAGGAVDTPDIVSRAGWGANEQYRYQRRRGQDVEVWPPTFARVQKLIVHHTAASKTIETEAQALEELRAIYYYHAVTQGWGDIGYNFLVGPGGTIYEGRYSGAGSPIGEQDGRIVTAGHTYQYNVGTVGIAMIGNASDQQATPEAQSGVRRLLAWEAARHHLDPEKTSTYRNIVNDLTIDRLNVAGHRDYVATECPGVLYYPLLAPLRSDVAADAAIGDGDVTAPPPPTELRAAGARRQITLSWQPSEERWPAQSGVAYYEIQRTTGAAGFVPIEHVDDLTLSFTDTGIRGEATYRIVAVDGAGNRGVPSAPVVGRTT